MSHWWSAHSHSHYSALDGMARVEDMVAKVAQMGQPAMALTDHGNLAGSVSLYKAAKKHGIAPFPGIEAYLLDPNASLDDKNAQRYHVCLLATDLKGYQGLLGLTNVSHTRPRFSRYPRITLDDLTDLSQDYSDHIALLTGCYFGLAQQSLVHDGPQKAENVVKMYASLFPHTFVEIQHHSICHDHDYEEQPKTDDDIVAEMVAIADRAGLPLIATQDSHYLDQNDKPAHALMKRMVYGGEEDEFPGDSFHMASADWVAEHYEDAVWGRVEEGCDWLLKQNEVVFPALDTFKAHVPEIVKNPDREIQRLCETALADYEPAQRRLAQYSERLDYELGIINELGMAGYFMVVRNYVEWCNDQGICIEARGSANGSLVCFLLGVTQVDPVRWKLLFDRFLSRDRIKPPDIDMDVEDVARGRLMGYLSNTFDTLQIGNWSQLGINDDGTGSVLVSYKTYLARKVEAEMRENEASADAIKRAKAEVYAAQDLVERMDPKERKALLRLGEMDVYRSYGVHASGMLLSGSDLRISDYVPHMLVASSDTHVSQFDQEAVEQLGYLKLDVLGQATLTVMRICQELIGRDDPTDFTWIPENDSAACKILREGRTENGIFHFEGYTKAKGGRQMGIKSTKDAVLATGLFMPGAMNTGQTDLYLERRNNPEKRAKVTYIHPAFEAALKDTYGAVVFQEQVINIMRGLGMSVDGINTFFKVVKSSGSGAVAANNKRLAEVRDEFDDLCREAGIAEEHIEKAWESTAGFVAYGFNRAHATGYGLRSYRCAYLKAHHPLEFVTALLQTHAGQKKEPLYVREARRMGIKVRPPSVQSTTSTWTMEAKRNAIRRPLVSIKGVGQKAADNVAEHAPYDSIEDLIERTDSRIVSGGKSWAKDQTLNGVLAKLRDAGALIELGIQKEGTE